MADDLDAPRCGACGRRRRGPRRRVTLATSLGMCALIGVSSSTATAALGAPRTPARVNPTSTVLHVDRLDTTVGAVLPVYAAIRGAREGDEIRLVAVRIDSQGGDPATGQPLVQRTRLTPVLAKTGSSLIARAEIELQRGLHVFVASYRRRGHVFARRHSLVRVGGPPDRPRLYDGLAAQPGAVTGHDLQTLRSSMRRGLPSDSGKPRSSTSRATRARAAATGATTAFRITPPQGRYRGRKPKGMIVIVHGGGWYGGGPANRTGYSLTTGIAYLDSVAVAEQRWNRRGYQTLNVDYHSGYSSRSDVARLVREAHRARPDLRVCFYGESAGANLSLLVAGSASMRKYVACVVGAAGPADLPILPDVPDDPSVHLCDFSASATYVRCLTEGWFGSAYLKNWSPADRPHARRIFAAEARNDEIVPPSQGASLRRKIGRKCVTHVVLGTPSGSDEVEFLHGTTTRSEMRRYFKAERAFVRRAMTSRRLPGGC